MYVCMVLMECLIGGSKSATFMSSTNWNISLASESHRSVTS